MSITEAEVFAQAVDQAGFLWCQRDAAVRDPRYRLRDLCELDRRLAAQLDLLRLGGEHAWQATAAAAGEGGAGEVFAAMSLALARRDARGMAPLIARGMDAPEIARGVVSALAWARVDDVRDVLPALLAGEAPPALRALGVAASAARRRAPGPELRAALVAEAPRLRARAIQAVGELGLVELLADVRPALEADDAAVRFRGAWTLALLGDAGGTEALLGLARAGGAFGERAAALALRRLSPLSGARWLRALPETPEALRVAIVAAGALGDPAQVSFLLDRMTTPALARLAGGALSMITGVDLVAEGLEGAALAPGGPSDDPEAEDVAPDPDDGLPWPDAAAVARWWASRRANFIDGRRYLAGTPADLDGAGEVLRRGSQPARFTAALERCLLRPRQGLFEVRARGDQQRAALGG